MKVSFVQRPIRIFLKKAMAGLLAVAFLLNNTFANAEDFTNLSPRLASTLPQFKERFRQGYIRLQHRLVNEYINSQIELAGGIENMRQRTDSIRLDTGKRVEILVVAVPELFRKRGQFAHVGLGKHNGKPVIWIDDDFFYDEEKLRDAKSQVVIERLRDAEAIERHEKDEITQYEWYRDILESKEGGERIDLREEWLRYNRSAAVKFHDEAYDISVLYNRYSRLFTEGDWGALFELYQIYGSNDTDISDYNIGTGTSSGPGQKPQPDTGGRAESGRLLRAALVKSVQTAIFAAFTGTVLYLGGNNWLGWFFITISLPFIFMDVADDLFNFICGIFDEIQNEHVRQVSERRDRLARMSEKNKADAKKNSAQGAPAAEAKPAPAKPGEQDIAAENRPGEAGAQAVKYWAAAEYLRQYGSSAEAIGRRLLEIWQSAAEVQDAHDLLSLFIMSLKNNTAILVVNSEGAVIGFITYRIDEERRSGYMEYKAVLAGYQHHDIGSHLSDLAIMQLWNRGIVDFTFQGRRGLERLHEVYLKKRTQYIKWTRPNKTYICKAIAGLPVPELEKGETGGVPVAAKPGEQDMAAGRDGTSLRNKAFTGRIIMASLIFVSAMSLLGVLYLTGYLDWYFAIKNSVSGGVLVFWPAALLDMVTGILTWSTGDILGQYLNQGREIRLKQTAVVGIFGGILQGLLTHMLYNSVELLPWVATNMFARTFYTLTGGFVITGIFTTLTSLSRMALKVESVTGSKETMKTLDVFILKFLIAPFKTFVIVNIFPYSIRVISEQIWEYFMKTLDAYLMNRPRPLLSQHLLSAVRAVSGRVKAAGEPQKPGEQDMARSGQPAGSISEGLECIIKNFMDAPFSLKQFAGARDPNPDTGKPYSDTLLRNEVNGLITLHILKIADRKKRPYEYALSDEVTRAPPENRPKLLQSVVRELNRLERTEYLQKNPPKDILESVYRDHIERILKRAEKSRPAQAPEEERRSNGRAIESFATQARTMLLEAIDTLGLTNYGMIFVNDYYLVYCFDRLTDGIGKLGDIQVLVEEYNTDLSGELLEKIHMKAASAYYDIMAFHDVWQYVDDSGGRLDKDRIARVKALYNMVFGSNGAKGAVEALEDTMRENMLKLLRPDQYKTLRLLSQLKGRLDKGLRLNREYAGWTARHLRPNRNPYIGGLYEKILINLVPSEDEDTAETADAIDPEYALILADFADLMDSLRSQGAFYQGDVLDLIEELSKIFAVWDNESLMNGKEPYKRSAYFAKIYLHAARQFIGLFKNHGEYWGNGEPFYGEKMDELTDDIERCVMTIDELTGTKMKTKTLKARLDRLAVRIDRLIEKVRDGRDHVQIYGSYKNLDPYESPVEILERSFAGLLNEDTHMGVLAKAGRAVKRMRRDVDRDTTGNGGSGPAKPGEQDMTGASAQDEPDAGAGKDSAGKRGTRKIEDKYLKGISYEEAVEWRRLIVEEKVKVPYGFWTNRTTALNMVLAALDTIDGFKEARDGKEIKKMVELYRREVIHYQPDDTKRYKAGGQITFFRERGGLNSMLNDRRDYLFFKHGPGALLRLAVPELLTDPEGLNPIEVERYYWTEPENAKYHVQCLLDTIPGFPEERTANNIKAMAGLYRRHVLGREGGQIRFFCDIGRLHTLVFNPSTYLSSKDRIAALLNLAVPGLVDDRNSDALTTREVSLHRAPKRKPGPGGKKPGEQDMTQSLPSSAGDSAQIAEERRIIQSTFDNEIFEWIRDNGLMPELKSVFDLFLDRCILTGDIYAVKSNLKYCIEYLSYLTPEEILTFFKGYLEATEGQLIDQRILQPLEAKYRSELRFADNDTRLLEKALPGGEDVFATIKAGRTGEVLSESGALHCNFIILFDKAHTKAALIHTDNYKSLDFAKSVIRAALDRLEVLPQDIQDMTAIIIRPQGKLIDVLEPLTESDSAEIERLYTAAIQDAGMRQLESNRNIVWYDPFDKKKISFLIDEGIMISFSGKSPNSPATRLLKLPLAPKPGEQDIEGKAEFEKTSKRIPDGVLERAKKIPSRGKRIKFLRKYMEMSIPDLTEATRITAETLNNMERVPGYSPRLNNLEKIADAFGMNKYVLVILRHGPIPEDVLGRIKELKTVKERLIALREYKGLNPRQLAELADVSRQTVANIEEGKVLGKSSDDVLMKLAKALEAPEDIFRIPVPRRIPAEVITRIRSLTTRGQRLEALMEYRGWTIERLSDESGVHPSVISYVKNDQRDARKGVLDRLAAGLGVAGTIFDIKKKQQNISDDVVQSVEEKYKTRGERLAEFRKHRGWTQEKLAEKSGVSKSHISRLENNHIEDPQEVIIGKLTNVLGVDASALDDDSCVSRLMIEENLRMGDECYRKREYMDARAAYRKAAYLARCDGRFNGQAEDILRIARHGIERCNISITKGISYVSLERPGSEKYIMDLFEEATRVANRELAFFTKGLYSEMYNEIENELWEYIDALVQKILDNGSSSVIPGFGIDNVRRALNRHMDEFRSKGCRYEPAGIIEKERPKPGEQDMTRARKISVTNPERVIKDVIVRFGLDLKYFKLKPADVIRTIKTSLDVSLKPSRSIDRDTRKHLPRKMRYASSKYCHASLLPLRKAYDGDLKRYADALTDMSSPAFHLLLDAIDEHETLSATALWRHRFELERLRGIAEEKIRAQYPDRGGAELDIFVPGVSKGHELAAVVSVVIEAAQEIMGDDWQRRLRLTLSGADIDTRSLAAAAAKLAGNFTADDMIKKFGNLEERKKTAKRVNGYLHKMARINMQSLRAGRQAPFKIELKAMSVLDDEAVRYFQRADIVSMNYIFMYLDANARLRLISNLARMKPGAVLLTDTTMSYIRNYVRNGYCDDRVLHLFKNNFVGKRGDVSYSEAVFTRKPETRRIEGRLSRKPEKPAEQDMAVNAEMGRRIIDNADSLTRLSGTRIEDPKIGIYLMEFIAHFVTPSNMEDAETRRLVEDTLSGLFSVERVRRQAIAYLRWMGLGVSRLEGYGEYREREVEVVRALAKFAVDDNVMAYLDDIARCNPGRIGDVARTAIEAQAGVARYYIPPHMKVRHIDEEGRASFVDAQFSELRDFSSGDRNTILSLLKEWLDDPDVKDDDHHAYIESAANAIAASPESAGERLYLCVAKRGETIVSVESAVVFIDYSLHDYYGHKRAVALVNSPGNVRAARLREAGRDGARSMGVATLVLLFAIEREIGTGESVILPIPGAEHLLKPLGLTSKFGEEYSPETCRMLLKAYAAAHNLAVAPQEDLMGEGTVTKPSLTLSAKKPGEQDMAVSDAGVSPSDTSLVSLLEAIRDKNDAELSRMLRGETAVVPTVTERPFCETLAAFGILDKTAQADSYRLADMMTYRDAAGEPDLNYTRTMINVVNNMKLKFMAGNGRWYDGRVLELANYLPHGKLTMVRELMKMAVIHEISRKQKPVVQQNKVLWHILDTELIPYEQRYSFVTQINKFFRDSNLAERIHIVGGGETVQDAITSIRRQCPDSVFSVGLADARAIDAISPLIRKDKEIRMLVFEGKAENFRQLGGIIAALRTLYIEESRIIPMLNQIFRILGARPYAGGLSPRELLARLADDPASFAREFICRLPPADRIPTGDLPCLNKRLREFIIHA